MNMLPINPSLVPQKQKSIQKLKTPNKKKISYKLYCTIIGALLIQLGLIFIILESRDINTVSIVAILFWQTFLSFLVLNTASVNQEEGSLWFSFYYAYGIVTFVSLYYLWALAYWELFAPYANSEAGWIILLFPIYGFFFTVWSIFAWLIIMMVKRNSIKKQ